MIGSLVRRGVPTLAVAAIMLVLVATPASAHAALTSSDPPAGAALTTMPSTVVLRFSDPVQVDGSSVTLHTATGAVPLAGMRLDGPNVLAAEVPEASSLHGPVSFDWTVVAADGHPSSGSINVGVGVPAATASRAPSAGAIDVADRLFALDRVVGYLAMTVLVGGWVFLAMLWPVGATVARARLVLWLAWGFGLLATVAGIGLEAATISGGRLGHALSPSALSDVVTSDFGHAWVARAVLFVLAVPLLRGLRRGAEVPRAAWWMVGAAAVGVGLLRTPGFVSHASEGNMAVVGSIADLVHLVGVAAWLGGLVFLLAVVLPRRKSGELARILPAFSRLAMASVVAIVAGGAVMSWELVGSLGHFTSTHFGRVLLMKVAGFIAIVVLARSSKRWVDNRLGVAVALRGHSSIVRPFVYSVAAETLLAAAVVAVASVLVSTSPGT